MRVTFHIEKSLISGLHRPSYSFREDVGYLQLLPLTRYGVPEGQARQSFNLLICCHMVDSVLHELLEKNAIYQEDIFYHINANGLEVKVCTWC